MPGKTIITNRRARFDFEPVDEFVAGLVLNGHETKSVRGGNVDLKGAYITLKDNEAWLTNAHIKRYEHAATIKNYEPTRPRKLLLSKRELKHLSKAKQNGLHIIPLKIVTRGQYIKVIIATAQSKKRRDKRARIQARDVERDVKRSLKKR